MLENLLSLAHLLNNDNVETLDLTKDEDYKKFHDAVETLKSYKKDHENGSLLGLLSSFISDELLDEIEEIGELAHNHISENTPKKVEITEDDDDKCYHCDNPCSICEKEYCDDCEYFEDTDEGSDEEPIKRPSEQIDNVDAKLQIHRLVAEYSDTYIKPYISNDEKGKKLINDAYAGLYEFACWIYMHN